MILSRRRYRSGGGAFSFGNCLDFDGTNDYVAFTDTSVYCDLTKAWSF